MKLTVLEGEFTIHRFSPESKIPALIFECSFYSISRTEEELSIVCSSRIHLNSARSETGWTCIKVSGPLDLSQTGILADISGVLAREEISIFALSTFDTDYILVTSDKLEAAKKALQKAGYIIQG